MAKQSYQWNPEDYEAHSSAQFKWAQELIRKLNLQGNERLLDIGCGHGKVSAAIAESLPKGSVVGIDSSQEMISLAAERYSEDKFPNLSFQTMDVRELDFESRFDVIFSNAALHWVTDHLAFLPKVRRSLKRSGKILFQMGGKGNAEAICEVMENLIKKEKWKPYFRGFTFPYGFFGPEEYKDWLNQAGLKAVRIELIPKDMTQKGREGLTGWIRTTWLPYTERVPETLRESFISEIADAYLRMNPADLQGIVRVNMVRLELEAVIKEVR